MTMNRMKRMACLLLLALAAGLAGCAASRPEATTLYDLGQLPSPEARPALPALPPLAVAEAEVPAWLDSRRMYFRLQYVNDQQPRPYATASWTMSPGQLLQHRLKARIAGAGGVALSTTGAAADVPVLRIEVDDFIQTFEAPSRSVARLAIRASLLRGRTLIAHRAFSTHATAASADAGGGAAALASASDAVIDDLMHWLNSLPLRQVP